MKINFKAHNYENIKFKNHISVDGLSSVFLYFL